MTGLDVRDLSVRYGALAVVHGVTLQVAPGEIVAVIGPNGAGKTSLLRTIAGTLRPAAGTITFDGRAIGGLPPWRVVRHGVALVPEGRGIFADQTVRDNLVLGATSRRGPDRLDDVLTRFPALRDRLEHPAGTLSGGQQQMLAIARGLMAAPRLLMLDEPSLGLAPRLVGEVFEAVRALRQGGVGVLLVEQLATVALAIADRAYVLERGRVAAAGPAATLAADPRIVAVYLGRTRDAAGAGKGPEGARPR